MENLGYILAGWIIALGAIAFYAAALRRRGRLLTQSVPAERRRWISSDE